ncbi:MAG: M48 family metalloprotease [Deltaproteobacteria bacterium]|nr:M48 family metalloprotease [Deltaproteobacteria bacterium]
MISDQSNTLIRIIVFLILVFLPGLVAAQDEAFDEYEEQPAVYWHVNIDAQGIMTTVITLMAKKDGPDAKYVQDELRAGLEEALQCTLENVRSDTKRRYFRINAGCRIPVVKKALAKQVLLKPSGLQSRLEKLGSYGFDLSITLPRLGHGGAPQGLKKTSYGGITTYHLTVKPGEKAVDDIALEFGYRKGYVIALITAISVVLMAPLALILVFRRRSLMLAEQDATAAWFGYWRVHRWIVEGIWLVWLIMFWTFNVDTFIGYLTGSDRPVLHALLLIVPPGLVLFACQYLTRPLWLKVRGIAWNRREMLVKGFWEHAAAILPFVFVIIGIGFAFQHIGQAMLWFAAAFIMMLFGAWMHGKISKTMPRALHGGELHEKILEMAQRAGVKIQQVFLMPSQHLQMGNAFAMQGRRVMITDYLLDRLTKQETDCVMAHEIGHVKKGHTLLLSWAGFLVVFLMTLVVLLFAFTIIPSFIPFLMPSQPQPMFEFQDWFREYLLYPSALVLAVLIRYFLSRRCERSADEFAALLTNDSENMITSLVKLSKMNLMPISWGRWDERLSTHPATLRRIERIAKNHRIPEDRLKPLLETQPLRQEGTGYTVPDEATNTGLVFSVERKMKYVLVNTMVILFVAALTPLLLGSSIGMAGLPAPAYATGLVLIPLLYMATASFVSVWGYGAMKRELAAKLKRDGFAKDILQGRFVGLSPEKFPRSYDGHTIWDIGFLLAGKDALVYSGDKVSFQIPRESIISIARGPSYPGWVTISETCIRWTDGKGEMEFHLHSLEGNSIFELAKQSKALRLRLMDWKQGRIAGERMPAGEAALSLPALPEVKGLHPNASAAFKGVLAAWMLVVFLVFGFSFLLGLDSAISWYGLGVASWCLLLGNLPAWRYSDGQRQSNLFKSKER